MGKLAAILLLFVASAAAQSMEIWSAYSERWESEVYELAATRLTAQR
jgi:hypothetical protein